jgi:proline iminopeptidase
MDRDAMVEYLTEFWHLVASPAHPTPEAERLQLVHSWVDRDYDTAANRRQFAAMVASGDRTALLQTIDRPALIIHGENDPLIKCEAGKHTAMCIRGASLHIIPGMGHDLPEALVPELAELIVDHLQRHGDAKQGIAAAGSA